jgi:hypothetical protein
MLSDPNTAIMADRPSALLVHDAKLFHAAAEIFIGGEFCGEIGDEIHGEPGADDLCADAHHVDVVMLDALMGRMHVVANLIAGAGVDVFVSEPAQPDHRLLSFENVIARRNQSSSGKRFRS